MYKKCSQRIGRKYSRILSNLRVGEGFLNKTPTEQSLKKGGKDLTAKP